MRGAVLHAPGDVRLEVRDDPTVVEPTDAIIRLSATCVCGSDLWPYRGLDAVQGPSPMGHEYAGVVREVGSQVTTIRPGQFVVGSFFASDNTCELSQAGYQTACVNKQPLGAERIIAMSRHAPRQLLATEYGATEIVEERGEDGVAAIKELTGGLGAHSVVEAVGTQESMLQAIRSTRPGGHVGYVGVAHGVELSVEELFFSAVHLHGGPAPVRRSLPQLIDLIWNRQINPGKLLDLS